VNRRLYRCRHDRVLAGVAGGVAEYFELDPSLVRVLWFLSIFVGGIGILLYIGMAIIVPIEPLAGEGTAEAAAVGGVVVEGHRHAPRASGRLTTFVGFGLILLGALALVDALLPAWEDAWRFLWPAFLVGIGALLVAGAIRREPKGS
jgi:phage shock protein PspC (stress-responsive transcriptional regulator)